MEKLWYKDPKILLNNDNKIIPNSSMKPIQKINSLAKIGAALVVFGILSDGNSQFLSMGLCILILSFIFSKPNMEKFGNQNENKCRKPTNNNPYMNVLRYNDNLNVPACEYSQDVDKKYKFNLYQNSKDLFDNKHLERQFYTMPVTTVPNDIVTFGKWLYGTKGNCKYDGTRCLQHEDERYH